MFEILTHIIATTDFNAIDLITKVDSFYQNSFTKLVWVISIALVVVGVVVPLVVNRLQQRSFNKAETKLLERIAETREELRAQITSESDAVKKELAYQSGVLYLLQTAPLINKASSDAMTSLFVFHTSILGAIQVLKAGQVDMVEDPLEDAESIFSSLPTLLEDWSQEKVDEIKKSLLNLLKTFEGVAMKEKSYEHAFSDQVEAIRSKIQQLKGKPEQAQ